jgi:hypothetical protein
MNTRSLLSNGLVLFGLTLCSLVFQNCSKVQFQTQADFASVLGNPVVPGGDPTCVPKDPTQITVPIKVLFIMDTSGSNKSNGLAGGTDVDKVWRLKVINDFLAKYGANPKVSYGLASFASTAQAHINDGGRAGFTNDSAALTAGIADFQARGDAGSTNYKTAFDLAKAIIANDQAAHPDPTAAYAIGFLSDGLASDFDIGTQNGLDELHNAVKSVLDVNPGKVTMSSVFYYAGAAPEAKGENMMKEVALAGKGIAAIANANQNFSIENSLIVPGVVCQ